MSQDIESLAQQIATDYQRRTDLGEFKGQGRGRSGWQRAVQALISETNPHLEMPEASALIKKYWRRQEGGPSVTYQQLAQRLVERYREAGSDMEGAIDWFVYLTGVNPATAQELISPYWMQ